MGKRTKETQANFCNRVRERDKWTCQECGSAEYPQAHHIEPYNGNNNNLENGVTLCVYCHANKHPEVPRELFISNVIKAEKEGHISAGKFAKELNIHPRTIVRKAIKLGILKPMQKWMFTEEEANILRSEEYKPSYSGDAELDKRMTVLINTDTWDALRKIANSRKMTCSDIAREAIYQLLGKQIQNGETLSRK